MSLTLNEYQAATKNFMNKDLTNREALLMFVLGISSESGEIAEAIKHNMFHHHKLDRDNLKKELGDLLWYLSGMADHFGWTLDEVAVANIDKLSIRYPNGFSSERSINRVENGLQIPTRP